MSAEIEALAERMYTDGVARLALGPAWHQLGETTKSVWRERAAAQLYGEYA